MSDFFARTIEEAADILAGAMKLEAELGEELASMEDGEFAANMVETIMLHRHLNHLEDNSGREIAMDPRMMKCAVAALVAAMCREAEKRQASSGAECSCARCRAASN